MTDAELMAAAAVIMSNAVEAIGENEMRRMNGESPAYRESGLHSNLLCEVEKELTKRSTHVHIEPSKEPVRVFRHKGSGRLYVLKSSELMLKDSANDIWVGGIAYTPQVDASVTYVMRASAFYEKFEEVK